MYMISEKYRLELHWDKLNYRAEGKTCELINARFKGPALSLAAHINPNDHIKLDFCPQYTILIKNYYVATLSWSEVVYNKDHTVT